MNCVGLTPVIPIVFAFALPLVSLLSGGNKKVVLFHALLGTGLALIGTFKVFETAYSSNAPLVYSFGKWIAPVGIVYEVERLNALIALLTASLMFLIAIYSYHYLEKEGSLEWYYTLYLGLEAGLLGVLFTGDAFNLFVMLEVTSVAAYALVMFYRDRGDSVVAGFKYSMIGAVGTTMYFLALGVYYGAFGTLNIADLSAKIHGISFQISGSPMGNIVLASGIALALTLWAFAVKAAIVPNHFWLPEAHPAAPTPISAILSGLVVNIGVYAMIRFLYTVYGAPLTPGLAHVVTLLSTILIVLGAASALFGALMMNVQKDIKRLIAYSTIMHMGYLFMAIGLGTQLGLQAALFHLINHAIAKALLFLAAGAFIHAVGSRNLDELAGVGRKMPLASFSLAVSSFALVGVPPLNIFFSKLLLFNAFMEKSIGLALILLLSSIIALIAYVRVFYVIWFGKPQKEANVKEQLSMSFVCLLLAVAIILIGLTAPMFVNKFIIPASSQTVNYGLYIYSLLKT